MQRQPVISWHNLDRSDAMEDLVHKRLAAVEQFCPGLIGARVVISAPQNRRHTARGVDVRIHLDLPGPDVDVAKSVRQGHADDDLTLAINRAFGALEERLKKARQRMDPQAVKAHPAVLHSEIVELDALGFGYLRGDDGQEVYFQKDSLVSGDWDQLSLGDRLRFREMDGDKGPYAVDIAPT